MRLVGVSDTASRPSHLPLMSRDAIPHDNLPRSVPPRFIAETNKPIPLALRRFLDEDDDKRTSKATNTNYSMTSSVIRRNQDLQNIDEPFNTYEDENIGALDLLPTNGQGALIDDDLVKKIRAASDCRDKNRFISLLSALSSESINCYRSTLRMERNLSARNLRFRRVLSG